jgi:hypothetical protein
MSKLSGVEYRRQDREVTLGRPNRPGKRRLMMQRWPMRWEAFQDWINNRRPTRRRTHVPVTR